MSLKLPSRRWWLILACLACVVIVWWQLAATRGGGKFTRAQFDAIRIGMPVAEVTQTLGAPSLSDDLDPALRPGYRRVYWYGGERGTIVVHIFHNKVQDKYYRLPLTPVNAARVCLYLLRELVRRYGWWLLLVAITGLAITVGEMKLWRWLR